MRVMESTTGASEGVPVSCDPRIRERRRSYGIGLVAVSMLLVLIPAVPGPAAHAAPEVRSEKPGAREEAAARVLAEIENDGDYPVTEEAVELVLLRFAQTGDDGFLDLAETMVRSRPAGDDLTEEPAGPYLIVAHAGGGTFGRGEERLLRARELMAMSPDRATTDSYARLVQDFFERAAVWGTSEAFLEAATGAGALFSSRVVTTGTRVQVMPGGGEAAAASLSDHIEVLEAARLSYELSGTDVSRSFVVRLVHETLRRFWDDDTGRLAMTDVDVVGFPAAVEPLLNARAAIVLWRCGAATGDALFTGRARRILDRVFDDALRYPESAPAAALAAELLDGTALEMILVGEAGDATLTALRRAAFRVPDPRRILVHANPVSNPTALAALGIPGEAAPALFLRAGSVGAPPVRDPADIPARIAEVWRAVGSVPR